MPNLIGSGPNQCPTNADLGKLAFMDEVNLVTNNPYQNTAISDVKPSLLLDFANSKTLDPRITYTRASTASYYDGKTTAMAEQNLLTYSQEFDNAIWFSGGGASKTANSTTAPDGTATADLITATATSTANGTFRTYSVAIGSTISVYAKKGSSNYIGVSGGDNNAQSWAYFDLNAGTVGNSNACTASITSVGNGWYRCALGNITVAGSYVIICTVDALGTTLPWGTTATAGNSFYVWGAQLEQRSSVTAYTPTTSQPITNYIPVMQTAAAGVPRFDHDPVTGESKGFLIEEQRSNLLTYSDQFDNAAWVKSNSSITSNTIVAPDGTLTGDKLVENTTNNNHNVSTTSLVTTTNGVSYTLSCYLKASERSWVLINAGAVAGTGAYFNVSSGTIGSNFNLTGSSITSVGNGWYRCSITFVGTGGSGYPYVALASTDNTVSYTGNGYSGLYIWGAQLEAGSFATSYIPTTSAQVTRSADAASMTGANFSSWYRQDAMSVYVEFISLGASAGAIWCVDAGHVADSGNNYISVSYTSGGNSIFLFVRTLGTNQALQTFSVPVLTTSKVVLSSATNDFRSAYNGSLGTADTSVAMPTTPSMLRLGNGYNDGRSSCVIKKLAYYPKRLSDAELQEMTL